jgi:hypothetical protein
VAAAHLDTLLDVLLLSDDDDGPWRNARDWGEGYLPLVFDELVHPWLIRHVGTLDVASRVRTILSGLEARLQKGKHTRTVCVCARVELFFMINFLCHPPK